MGKHKLLIRMLLLLAALPVAAQQSSVHYEGWIGQRDVWTSASVALANGNSVMVGYFDSSINVMSVGSDLEQLAGAWHVYGSTAIQTQFGTPGLFSDTDSGTSTFDGQKIWLWIFKTTDNAAPTPTYSNVSEYGLFSSTLAAWNYPSASAIPPGNRTDIDTSQINQIAFGSINGNHLVLRQYVPVPEPPAGAIIATSLTWFVLVVRKRKAAGR